MHYACTPVEARKLNICRLKITMNLRPFKFPLSTLVKKCASAKICKKCYNFFIFGPNLTYNISKCVQISGAHIQTL